MDPARSGRHDRLPPIAGEHAEQDLVWIGNYAEGERADEIREYLIRPAAALRAKTKVFGVRYPDEGLEALAQAGISFEGYLPNLEAPFTYARSRLTVHIPRQQYSAVMAGIPTIRVFEALACGIPLLSAPWQDTEKLFNPGDFQFVGDGAAMQQEMRRLLADPQAAAAQAAQGSKPSCATHLRPSRAGTNDHPRLIGPGAPLVKIFAFGSSIVSSYWNGAATYYRGCYKYLARLGYDITFAEPDAYGRQQHRDSE